MQLVLSVRQSASSVDAVIRRCIVDDIYPTSISINLRGFMTSMRFSLNACVQQRQLVIKQSRIEDRR